MKQWKGWALLSLLVGCTSVEQSVLEEMMPREDARDGDVQYWEALLTREESPALRARAARAIGRLRAESLDVVMTRALEIEQDPAVIEELLFAIGQTPSQRTIAALLQSLQDSRGGVRARAAEALGKRGDSTAVPALLAATEDSDPGVRGAALLALARIRGKRAAPERPLDESTEAALLQRLTERCQDSNGEVRWKAVYALAEIEIDGREAALREALDSSQREERFFALRGLTGLTDSAEFPVKAVASVLRDSDPHVAANAAWALALRGDPRVIPVLRSAFEKNPDSFHVRDYLLASLGKLVPVDAEWGEFFQAALDDVSPTVRARALKEWAPRGGDRARERIHMLARRPAPWDRWGATRAAGNLDPLPVYLLEERLVDEDPRVSVEALNALATLEGKQRHYGLRGLQHADMAMRGTALSILREHGAEEDATAVGVVLLESTGDENAEVRVEAVRTLAALGGNEATQRLLDARGDPSAAVRRAVEEGLANSDEKPRVVPSESRSTVTLEYGQDYSQKDSAPRVELQTTRGEIVLELFREDAPRHVKSFLNRMAQGAYDDLSFHRVVTGFVVQGLDPRGDGWGSGGVLLHDEINPRPYLTGALGMPNAGPDTGGCQIFITHVPTPHLDGNYTVFGQVVEGMDVVDRLEVGDRCLGIERL